LRPTLGDSVIKSNGRGFRHTQALPAKTKQVIAVAVAHVTQCPYCIKGHTKAALRHGATPEELMEAIWVAAEMRAGGAYAHSAVSLVAMDETADRAPSG
jgi:AhpD family alkylhydroperoxidase